MISVEALYKLQNGQYFIEVLFSAEYESVTPTADIPSASQSIQTIQPVQPVQLTAGRADYVL